MNEDGPNSRDGKAAFLERLKHSQLASLAARPQTPEEAFAHVRQGLVRVVDAARLLASLPEFDAFSSEEWHTLRMVAEGLHAAIFVRHERAAVTNLRAPVRAWHKAWGGAPVGGGASKIQSVARSVAAVVEEASRIGLEAAIAKSEGLPAPAAAGGVTRQKVATYLAIRLQQLNRELPSPVFERELTVEEATEVVYLAMPLEHASQTDRTGSFREEPFASDSKKTVVAAFKALGLHREKADKLFHADTVKRNRKTQKRLRKGRPR